MLTQLFHCCEHSTLGEAILLLQNQLQEDLEVAEMGTAQPEDEEGSSKFNAPDHKPKTTKTDHENIEASKNQKESEDNIEI